MLPSRNNEEKFEAKFATRLDVLMERVDMLASTVGTTASALAKKDGEIAALQKAFETRDETIRALVQHVNRAAEAQPADAPIDESDLRSLRNAVAALTKERASGVNAAQIESLVTNVRTLGQKVEALSAAAAAAPTTDPAVLGRIDALAGEVAVVKSAVQRLSEPQDPPEELVAMVSATRDQVAALGELHASANEDHERRLGATSDALATQSQRIDALTEAVAGIERTHAAGGEQLERRLEESELVVETLLRRLAAVAETIGGVERAHATIEDQLDTRFRETHDALAGLSQRLDAAPTFDEERLDRRLAEGDRGLRELGEALARMSQRLDSVRGADEEKLDRRFEAANDAQALLAQRLDALAETTRRLEQARAQGDETVDRRFGATDEALATMSRRVEDLRSMDTGQLEQRVDTLAATVEAAAASLGDKERELTALHRHFTESSSRIEAIVDDIREALHALPEQSSSSLDVAARIEGIETAIRKSDETGAQAAGELSSRIDMIDQRVASVAEEVSRAKTLWPVALRSLEARLDDAVHSGRPEPSPDRPHDTGLAVEHADPLAGLRESLEVMETVAAEMGRAASTLSGSADEAPPEQTSTDEPAASELAAADPSQEPQPAPAAAAGGTIVPLRTGEP